MDILYQNLAKILKINHSNLFLSGFLARYPNSESRFEKLVKFYTKAMLRFFIIGKLLEKYDPEQSGANPDSPPTFRRMLPRPLKRRNTNKIERGEGQNSCTRHNIFSN